MNHECVRHLITPHISSPPPPPPPQGRYVGEFVNGVRSGVGKADLSNGDRCVQSATHHVPTHTAPLMAPSMCVHPHPHSWEGEFGIGHTPPPPERLDDTSRLWGRSCALEPRDAKGTPHGALAGMPKRVAHYKPQNVELIVDDTMGMYNPYAGIGVPHGEGVLTFADGSTYTVCRGSVWMILQWRRAGLTGLRNLRVLEQGQMENGIPHGKGEYRARTGAVRVRGCRTVQRSETHPCRRLCHKLTHNHNKSDRVW